MARLTNLLLTTTGNLLLSVIGIEEESVETEVVIWGGLGLCGGGDECVRLRF